jgi:hypothetical protein
VIGIVSAFLESLLGLSPPIVSEKYPEVRQRIKDRETSSMQAFITEATVEKTLEPQQTEQPGSSPAQDAAAVLAMLGTNGETPAAPSVDEVAAMPAKPVQTEQEA